MTIFVGVDAGATRTRAVAVSDDGTMTGSGETGPANPHNIGPGPAAAEIGRAIRDASPDEQPEVLVAGVAGVEDPELQRELRYALEALQPAREIRLYSDFAIALDGAFLGGPGVIVIAGTGSVAYGRNARGEEARAGGWGHLVDDLGSGYDISRRALHAVIRAYDGRGQPTALSQMLQEAVEVETPPLLIAAVRRMDHARIASLARIVVKSADGGDAVARMIIRNAASELAAMATAVWQRLNLDEETPVAPVGGLFADSRIRKAFAASLARKCPQAVVGPPRLPPVAGAVWKALVLKGHRPDEKMVEQLDTIARTVGETSAR